MAADQVKPLNPGVIKRGAASSVDPDLQLRERLLDEQAAQLKGVPPEAVTQLRLGGEQPVPPVLVPVRKDTPRKAFGVRLKVDTAAGVAAMAYYTGRSAQDIADEALENALNAWRSDWRNLIG
jgi:hypothetical protein